MCSVIKILCGYYLKQLRCNEVKEMAELYWKRNKDHVLKVASKLDNITTDYFELPVVLDLNKFGSILFDTKEKKPLEIRVMVFESEWDPKALIRELWERDYEIVRVKLN